MLYRVRTGILAFRVFAREAARERGEGVQSTHAEERPERYIGCCGAYCRTCRAFADVTCRGCKLGYESGARALESAKCAMKRCCLGRGHETCADCPEATQCPVLQGFFGKNGYKYRKYRESTEFIRAHGYDAFVARASGWKGACGPLG